MIYVTHDQVEAMTLADRIVLLRDGIIEQMGTPLELFERPISKFVAGFLGSPTINFVPATLCGQNNSAMVRFSDGRAIRLPISRMELLMGEKERSVVCGIRPEHIRPTTEGGLQVKIDLLQPTGSRSYATFRLSGESVVAELEAHDVTRVDEEIAISIDPERLILIDPATDRVLYSK